MAGSRNAALPVMIASTLMTAAFRRAGRAPAGPASTS